MAVSIEWIDDVGIVRAGPEHRYHGDPYTVSGVVVDQGTAAELKGFSGEFTKHEYEALVIRLHRVGFHTIIRDRIKGGLTRRKEITMDAQIEATVTINGKKYTLLQQKFTKEKELLQYQLALMGGVGKFIEDRIAALPD